MNRRTFVRDTALLSLTSMSTTAFDVKWLKSSVIPGAKMKRRNLVPFFVVEDVLRLIQYSNLDQKLIDALEVNQAFIHLASANNLPREDLNNMIRDSLSKWSSEDTLDEGQTQASYLIGSILFPRIDSYLPYELPSYQMGETIPPLSEEAIGFDILVMQAIFQAEPWNGDDYLDKMLPAAEKEELSHLFHLIRQRNLIRTHTFRPEFSNVEPWLENFLQYHHLIEVENQRYADLYLNPDSINMHASWIKFYNAKDDIIQLARDTQVGISESTINLSDAIKNSPNQSTYAQILASCIEEIKAWDRCISGEITDRDLIVRYDRM